MYANCTGVYLFPQWLKRLRKKIYRNRSLEITNEWTPLQPTKQAPFSPLELRHHRAISLFDQYPSRGAATSLWIRKSSEIVSGFRRPIPHSVATPKSTTTFCAAAILLRVPSTPSVKCTNPRYSSVSGCSCKRDNGAK